MGHDRRTDDHERREGQNQCRLLGVAVDHQQRDREGKGGDEDRQHRPCYPWGSTALHPAHRHVLHAAASAWLSHPSTQSIGRDRSGNVTGERAGHPCRAPCGRLPTRQVVTGTGLARRSSWRLAAGPYEGRTRQPCHHRAIHSRPDRSPADTHGPCHGGRGLRRSPPDQVATILDLAFGARGRRCRRSYRTITSFATRSTLTRGALRNHRGDADATPAAPQRPPRLAVCRDRGGPWPVLRHRWHRLDDVHLQRDPCAGLVHHVPCHHRRRTGRRARAHWWPSSVLTARQGTAATGAGASSSRPYGLLIVIAAERDGIKAGSVGGLERLRPASSSRVEHHLHDAEVPVI